MSQIILTTLEQSFMRLKISSNIIGRTHLPQSLPSVQCVRYYRPRKPFWLPVAKSKMFRFHVKPFIPPEEDAELARLIRVYRTYMKSLRQYFKEQLMAKTTGVEVLEERKRKLEEQHAECIKINDLWNAEVAKIREERLAKEAIMREEKIVQKIISKDREQKEFLEQLDAHVRKEKEAAKTFITPENIDEAIEVALSNVVDHNFAIDLEGNIYAGRYGKPAKPPPGNKRATALPEALQEQEKIEPAKASN